MMKEILKFAATRESFTSLDVRNEYPKLHPANVTTALRKLAKRGDLERETLRKDRRNGPMYVYRLVKVDV
jgi:predicted transcriptional regulator